MILIYITCENKKQAKEIGRKLLEKRLTACVNIIPQINSLFLWPPKEGKIKGAKEAVLIVKTEDNKFKAVEKEVLKLHSYETPFIGAIELKKVHQPYLSWLKSELKLRTSLR